MFKDPKANLSRESLITDLTPEHAEYAALLCSKVYFYIGYYDEAVSFALKAGQAFGKEPQGEYKETIIGELRPIPAYLLLYHIRVN